MIRIVRLLTVAIFLFFAVPTFAGPTQGTLIHSRRAVALKYAYLVKGPDAVDTKKIIRRLILSGNDVGAKIQACASMSCTDGTLTDGMTVDLDGGPRFNYWMAVGNAMVQYSGTKESGSLKLSTDSPKQLVGKLSFDDTSMGGPKVDVSFDATLAKEFTQAR